MQVAGIFVWWLLITVFGFVTIPITLKLFPNLPDRGYSFTKPLSLLLIGLLTWLIGFIAFSVITIIAITGLIAGLSFWLWLRDQEEIKTWFSENKAYILIVELFFAVLFLAFLFFRMYNPDVLGTEKFMDLAFLNAIARSPQFPPYDPWLSGSEFYISYYYFGYLLMALFVKLSAVPPAIGFNLSLAMLYALSGIAVFGLLYNMTKRLSLSFGGWAFIYLIGNLDGFKQVLQTRTIDNFNWWTPSRVIPDTINEFPFFSYLLGDMHPHMLAVPVIMLALAMALNHLKSDERDVMPNQPERLIRFGVWGITIGSLGFINSWDLPSMFFMAMLVFFFQQYRQRPDVRTMPWKSMLLGLGVILGMSIIPYIPFYANFHSQAKGINLTTQNTRISDFLLIFGPYMFVIASFIVIRYYSWFVALVHPPVAKEENKPARKVAFCSQCGAKLRDGKWICGQCGHLADQSATLNDKSQPFSRPFTELPEAARNIFLFLLQPAAYFKQKRSKTIAFGMITTVLVIGGMMLMKALTYGQVEGNPAPAMMGLMLVLITSMIILLIPRIDVPETVFTYCMLGTGFLLLFGCEFLHINDTFQPPLDRMNTVFKFYYMSWFLLGLSAIYGLYWVFNYSFKNANLKVGWLIALTLLIAASLVYPYAGTMIKTNHFKNVATLDGSHYLRNSYPADREGIEWLRTHAVGNPVVLEATGGEYTDYARVSTFTGLPSVLGWGGHELQWRGNYDEPGKRIPDIKEMYSTLDANKAQALLDKYNVVYVFVGTLEKKDFSTVALEKFGSFMDVAFKKPGVTIYRRK